MLHSHSSLLIFASLLTASTAFATPCAAPNPDAATAFKLIESPAEGSLKAFLETHVVSKTARNERCETMYHAAIRARNELARTYLDSIGFGPRNAEELEHSDDGRLGEWEPNYYDYAVMNGTLSAILDLRKRGGHLGWRAYQGHTELTTALANPSIEVLDYFIKEAKDINEQGPYHRTPLMLALSTGSKPKAERILRAGGNVNLRDDDQRTPLFYAVAAPAYAPDLVALILRAGADIDAIDEHGRSPLIQAAQTGSLPVVKALVYAGADANIAYDAEYPEEGSSFHVSALYVAAAAGSSDRVDILMDVAHSDPKVTSGSSLGILHWMIRQNRGGTISAPIVKQLIQAGVPTCSGWKEQDRPIDYAIANGIKDPEILDLLKCPVVPKP